MDPHIIVGLGNPGTEYEETRHNVGYRVLDELARRWKKQFRPGRGEYLILTAADGGRDVHLVKPLTYMNNSGLAVAEVLERFDASPGALLVVADDFQIPLGTLRLRRQGSDGGHNGLYSIIYHLQSDAFPRLRCGIGREMMPPKREMASFVLSPFEPGEADAARQMTERAADAVATTLHAGLAAAMNAFST